MDLTPNSGFVPAPDGMYRPGPYDKLIVQFFRGTVQDKAASTAEGRPVFKGVDMVRYQHPGERDVAIKMATEEHKMRWPRQWAAYQQGQEQAPEGTPLDVLFPAQPEIVETLRHLKVLTVEQLAGATEEALSRMGMGARQWQARAKQFMEAASSSAPLRKLEAENEDLKDRIKQLEEQVRALAASREGSGRRRASRDMED